MKVSELISKLEETKNTEGDIPVFISKEDYEGRMLFKPRLLLSEYSENVYGRCYENPGFEDDIRWLPCVVIER